MGRHLMGTLSTAAVVREPGAPFRLEPLELDDVRADEILVDVEAVGICHTDIAARHQAFPVPLPIVLGHEGTGRVVTTGADVRHLAAGDRVLLSAPFCGHCKYCVSGRPRHCPHAVPLALSGGRPDGSTAFHDADGPVHSHFSGQSSFATRTIALASTAVKVPDDVPAEIVAPLGCGIATGAGAVANVLRPGPGSSLVVFGVGPVGLAAVMAAAVVGCNPIIAVDRLQSRLDLARELGATHVVDASGRDPVEAVVSATAGGADFVVQAAPSTKLLEVAIEAAGPGGVVAVVGAGSHLETAAVHPIALVNGPKTLRGVKGGEGVPEIFVPYLVEEWRRGRLPIERLVRTFDFDAINEAERAMEDGSVLKPVLCMS
jgi:aryl-alcohol dehydrogenase